VTIFTENWHPDVKFKRAVAKTALFLKFFLECIDCVDVCIDIVNALHKKQYFVNKEGKGNERYSNK